MHRKTYLQQKKAGQHLCVHLCLLEGRFRLLP